MCVYDCRRLFANSFLLQKKKKKLKAFFVKFYKISWVYKKRAKHFSKMVNFTKSLQPYTCINISSNLTVNIFHNINNEERPNKLMKY